jgi:hypothetical protein
LVAGSYRHALSKYFKSTSLILSLDKLWRSIVNCIDIFASCL